MFSLALFTLEYRYLSNVSNESLSSLPTTNGPQKEGASKEHYMVFSTDCSSYHEWQSYIFFYHAYKTGQPGNVTRIVSGCTLNERKRLQNRFTQRISIMSEYFHVHFTPDYRGTKPGMDYVYFNKPYGIRHWMENALGYPDNTDHDDDIIILMDPDQLLLRPLTHDFTHLYEIWNTPKSTNITMPKLRVEHGLPFGQVFGFGGLFLKQPNVTYVAGPDSPALNVTIPQARDFYSVGPPILATERDMRRIVEKWTEFVPRVLDDYPAMLAEMFGYSLAAAHLELPHQLAKSFMVSDPLGPEGWAPIDAFQSTEENLPHVMHYCQEYSLGPWKIGKRSLRDSSWALNCKSPLLAEPPSDIVVKYNASVKREPNYSRRQAFMLCTMIAGINEAVEFYKRNHCNPARVNWNKTYRLH